VLGPVKTVSSVCVCPVMWTRAHQRHGTTVRGNPLARFGSDTRGSVGDTSPRMTDGTSMMRSASRANALPERPATTRSTGVALYVEQIVFARRFDSRRCTSEKPSRRVTTADGWRSSSCIPPLTRCKSLRLLRSASSQFLIEARLSYRNGRRSLICAARPCLRLVPTSFGASWCDERTTSAGNAYPVAA
jgi:hypothetical protein